VRHTEDEDADVVLARLKASKPQPPKTRVVAGRKVPPSAEAMASYTQRLEAWQSAVTREEKFKAGKREEWDIDTFHDQANERAKREPTW
jgi:hypothetical protein